MVIKKKEYVQYLSKIPNGCVRRENQHACASKLFEIRPPLSNKYQFLNERGAKMVITCLPQYQFCHTFTILHVLSTWAARNYFNFVTLSQSPNSFKRSCKKYEPEPDWIWVNENHEFDEPKVSITWTKWKHQIQMWNSAKDYSFQPQNLLSSTTWTYNQILAPRMMIP